MVLSRRSVVARAHGEVLAAPWQALVSESGRVVALGIPDPGQSPSCRPERGTRLTSTAHLVGEEGGCSLARAWSTARIMALDGEVASQLGVLLADASREHVDPELVGLCADLGFFDDLSGGGGWEFHDALFATRTRADGAIAGYGKVVGSSRSPTRPTTPVHRSYTLTRRPPGHQRAASVRAYADESPSLDQLTRFLERTFVARPHRDRVVGEQTYSFPYPGAGGVPVLQPVLVGRPARELAGGVHVYDPVGHELHEMRGCDPAAVEQLLARANATADCETPAPAVVCLVAGSGGLDAVYRGMAFAAVLKTVGAAMTAAYVSAEATGVAVCALGGGEGRPTALAPVLAHERFVVGELLLGLGERSPRAPRPPDPR